MIQLNLLPDVKLEYLKSQRTRRLAIVVSFIAGSAAIAILVIMLSVEGFQKHTLSNLNTDVTNQTNTLQKEPQINKLLTVQNQLDNINSLHDKKPAANRLFDYLNQLTPSTVNIGQLDVDFNAYTITISGSADSLSSVNQYIDTLKFTKYNTGPKTTTQPAFTSVVLSSFSLSNTTTPPATYTITASYAPTLFDITQNVSLVIPSTVTTRSETEHPSPLFVETPSATNQNGGSN